MLFAGHSEHTIDAKGRISIPARYRTALKEENEGVSWYCLAWAKECLRIFTKGKFEALEKQWKQSLAPNRAASRFERGMFSLAEPLDSDEKGRIPLPKLLMDQVGLAPGTPIVIAGVRNRLEIWEREAWKAEQERIINELPDLVEAMEIRTPGGSGNVGGTNESQMHGGN